MNDTSIPSTPSASTGMSAGLVTADDTDPGVEPVAVSSSNAGDSGSPPDTSHSAWAVLDDAWLVLKRAESVVLLMGQGPDLPEQHIYAAEVACELLERLKDQLRTAQELVRPVRRLG